MPDNIKHPDAEKNQQYYRRGRDARVPWDNEARTAIDFIIGNQYTSSESSDLQSIGQADFTLDRVYPAIDKLKSILTARKPMFTALAREDSDNKMASVWKVILEYVWDISRGNTHFKQAIHDFAVTGLGYWYGYVDREADYERGEVKFTSVDPFRVYVDPAARDRYFQDAAWMVLSTILTKEQLLNLYGEIVLSDGSLFKNIVDDIEGHPDEDYPPAQNKNTIDARTPAETKDLDREAERFQVLERFEKVQVPFFWIADLKDGVEKVVSGEKLEEMKEVPEFQSALQENRVKVREISQTRIKVVATLGQHKLYEEVLNTDIYPIVPIPNIWTNTPYPKSDVNKVKDAQRLLNKVFSLVLSHAQTSAGLKLLIPEGSMDVDDVEKKWANPTAVLEYNPEYGEPHVANSSPLAAEFYNLIDRVQNSIDLTFGTSDLQQGLKSGSTGLVRSDMLLTEQGEGRGKAKLRDIEESLSLIATVIKNLCKGHYTQEKTFRIVQPNNNLTEFTVNVYDDKSQEVAMISNDITIGDFDIKMVTGSSLPSNRQVEAQQHLEFFKAGIIDDIEVLKKQEVYDIEGIIKRNSQFAKLKRAYDQLVEENKKLSGDMETADRELKTADRRVAGEKFKADLDAILADAKATQKITTGKLTERISSAIDKAEFALKTQVTNKKQEVSKSQKK